LSPSIDNPPINSSLGQRGGKHSLAANHNFSSDEESNDKRMLDMCELAKLTVKNQSLNKANSNGSSAHNSASVVFPPK
jgi:hypothetical protein